VEQGKGRLYFDRSIRKNQSKSLDQVQAGPASKILQVSFRVRQWTLSRILFTAIPASTARIIQSYVKFKEIHKKKI
jgi:hypothetical protein